VNLQAVFEHGHHADGEIAGYAATDLKEPNGMFPARRLIPMGQINHVLNAGANRIDIPDVASDDVAREGVAKRGVLPAGNPNRQALLSGRCNQLSFGSI
jgi:hypothetical protein